VTCVLLLPFFFVPCCFPQQFPQQWGYPTLKNKYMIQNLFMIVFFTAMDLGFTNIALSEISTSIQQCIASTNPFWTILIESMLYKKLQHTAVYFVVVVMVIGAALSAVSSFDNADTWGIICALIAVLCSASKYIFTHKAFREFKDQMGALALLFWVDLLMCPIYLIWAGANGELYAMFAYMGDNPEEWGAFTGTAALGGVRALTQYIVLIFVSATSMSTANTFTQNLNIIISIFTQKGTSHELEVTPMLVAGISIVMIFSFGYTVIKLDKRILPAIDEKMPICAEGVICAKFSKPEKEEKETEAVAAAEAGEAGASKKGSDFRL